MRAFSIGLNLNKFGTPMPFTVNFIIPLFVFIYRTLSALSDSRAKKYTSKLVFPPGKIIFQLEDKKQLEIKFTRDRR